VTEPEQNRGRQDSPGGDARSTMTA
jgi:hypothetical protein